MDGFPTILRFEGELELGEELGEVPGLEGHLSGDAPAVLNAGHLLLGVANLAGDLVGPGDGGVGVVVQRLDALPSPTGDALGEGQIPREEVEANGVHLIVQVELSPRLLVHLDQS